MPYKSKKVTDKTWYTIHCMHKGLSRFLKYFLVGFSTFLFDLFLLYFLTDVALLHYLLATALAFIFAVSVNYYFSRKFVFSKTTRKVNEGYYIFLGVAGIGLVLVVLLMALLVEKIQLNYVVARIIVAGIVGIFSYTTNLFLNFKVAGTH